MTAPTTYLRRKVYGDKSWVAKTTEEFDLDGRIAQLTVSTWKDDRRRLVTMASVGFVSGPGVVTTAIFSDFSAWLDSSEVRCTEKAISEQQARNVAQWGALKGKVLDFYAAKAAA